MGKSDNSDFALTVKYPRYLLSRPGLPKPIRPYGSLNLPTKTQPVYHAGFGIPKKDAIGAFRAL